MHTKNGELIYTYCPFNKNGKKVYNSPSVQEIKKYCQEEINTLWDEMLRFENPHHYYVDLSQKLWDEKQSLLSKSSQL